MISALQPRDVGRAAVLYRDMIDFLSRRGAAEGRSPDPGLSADPEVLDRQIRSCLGSEEDLFLLLWEEGAAVGFLDSSLLRAAGVEDSWFIKAVFIRPPFDSLGAFRELVSDLERRLRAKGVGSAFSTALMDDGTANGLWEALGYAQSGKRRIKLLAR
jgi:GNAT superfamily N-acetyltransferase